MCVFVGGHILFLSEEDRKPRNQKKQRLINLTIEKPTGWQNRNPKTKLKDKLGKSPATLITEGGAPQYTGSFTGICLFETKSSNVAQADFELETLLL